MNNSSVRVRFAPSPTGPLHIGGIRTALYNYLLARKTGGVFILRIEDTDQSRYVEGAEKYIIDSLQWVGIKIDEGVSVGGDFAPYRQSERKEIYQEYAQKLIEEKKAYYAFDSEEELAHIRQGYEKNGATFQYNSISRYQLKNSLTLSEEEVKARLKTQPYVIRLLINPNEEIRFQDLIRDWVVVHSSQIDDKVLVKSDGLPTYHLANVVDDYLMKITHVIRGEEWLPSAPFHQILYRYLGVTPPKMAHLPLILKPEGNGKLSKRDGELGSFPVSPLNWEGKKGFREEGYLPEALLNFLLLLGWSSRTEEEIFSIDDMISRFSLEDINKAGARFSIEKLQWFNQQYLKNLSPQVGAEKLREFLPDTPNLEQWYLLFKDRVTFLKQAAEEIKEVIALPKSYDWESIQNNWTPEIESFFYRVLEEINSEIPFHEAISGISSEQNIKIGKIMKPLRVLITGKSQGIDLMQCCDLLGVEECTKRIKEGLRLKSLT